MNLKSDSSSVSGIVRTRCQMLLCTPDLEGDIIEEECQGEATHIYDRLTVCRDCANALREEGFYVLPIQEKAQA